MQAMVFNYRSPTHHYTAGNNIQLQIPHSLSYLQAMMSAPFPALIIPPCGETPTATHPDMARVTVMCTDFLSFVTPNVPFIFVSKITTSFGLAAEWHVWSLAQQNCPASHVPVAPLPQRHLLGTATVSLSVQTGSPLNTSNDRTYVDALVMPCHPCLLQLLSGVSPWHKYSASWPVLDQSQVAQISPVEDPGTSHGVPTCAGAIGRSKDHELPAWFISPAVIVMMLDAPLPTPSTPLRSGAVFPVVEGGIGRGVVERETGEAGGWIHERGRTGEDGEDGGSKGEIHHRMVLATYDHHWNNRPVGERAGGGMGALGGGITT